MIELYSLDPFSLQDAEMVMWMAQILETKVQKQTRVIIL